MNNPLLRGMALVCLLISFSLAATADCPKGQMDWFGYCFEPATGKVYLDGKAQPYTFENAILSVLGKDGVWTETPLQYSFAYATRATAEKVLTVLKELTPGVTLEIVEFYSGAPYSVNVPMRQIRVGSAGYLNAGLIANQLMRSGENGKRALLAEIEKVRAE